MTYKRMYECLYSILHRWKSAAPEEIVYAKKTLMPEDDADQIVFRVTEHPNIGKDKQIFIEWFDIDVVDTTTYRDICNIVIWTCNGYIEYSFV